MMNIHPVRLYGLAILVGVVIGGIATVFRVALIEALMWREQSMNGLADGWNAPIGLAAFLVGAVLFSLAAWLTHRFAPETAGSGIPEIVSTLSEVRLPLRPWRIVPVKFIGGLLAMGAGGVLGREGPTIHIGGALGQWLAGWARLPEAGVRILIAIGSGVGLAAAFNAPLAGMLFVREELKEVCEDRLELVYGLLLACGAATLMTSGLMGAGPALPLPSYSAPPLAEWALFAVLGGMMGILGVVFNTALLGIVDLLAICRRRFGLLTGPALIGGVIGLLTVFSPQVVGEGDTLIVTLAAGRWPLALLLALSTVRAVTFLLSYGAGVPGGLFTPQLALGALAGLSFAESLQILELNLVTASGAFVVAGMAALLVATIRAPLTGILLVTEMTFNYELIPALLAACVPALLVAQVLGGRPLYSLLLDYALNGAIDADDTRSRPPALDRYRRLNRTERHRRLLERARH